LNVTISSERPGVSEEFQQLEEPTIACGLERTVLALYTLARDAQ
jgi:hypothetical protein